MLSYLAAVLMLSGEYSEAFFSLLDEGGFLFWTIEGDLGRLLTVSRALSKEAAQELSLKTF